MIADTVQGEPECGRRAVDLQGVADRCGALVADVGMRQAATRRKRAHTVKRRSREWLHKAKTYWRTISTALKWTSSPTSDKSI
eukprot:4581880-Prymnesium_polylepis.1